jgi:hypothetical protein
MNKYLQEVISQNYARYWRGFFAGLLAVDIVLGLAVLAMILFIK